MSILLKPRGISCIFSPTRKDKDRCAPLLRPRARASALPPAPAPSDTANLFADAAAVVQFLARLRANVVAHSHAQRQRLLLPRHSAADFAAAPHLAAVLTAASRPAFPGCERSYRSLPSLSPPLHL